MVKLADEFAAWSDENPAHRSTMTWAETALSADELEAVAELAGQKVSAGRIAKWLKTRGHEEATEARLSSYLRKAGLK